MKDMDNRFLSAFHKILWAHWCLIGVQVCRMPRVCYYLNGFSGEFYIMGRNPIVNNDLFIFFSWSQT